MLAPPLCRIEYAVGPAPDRSASGRSTRVRHAVTIFCIIINLFGHPYTILYLELSIILYLFNDKGGLSHFVN